MGEPIVAPVRVALLGAGRIAQSAHLPAIARAPYLHLVGIFDPSEYLRVAVAGRYAVTAFPTAQALLEDPTIEAVIVAVPDRFHAATTIDALAAGKHVLVEKPLASTVAEAESVRLSLERGTDGGIGTGEGEVVDDGAEVQPRTASLASDW